MSMAIEMDKPMETKPAQREGKRLALGELGDALVMMVDDEPLVIELTQAFLQKAGYRRFVSTSDPLAAIPIMLRERPDVLLLDINMPRLNGLDVLAKMQADPAWQAYAKKVQALIVHQETRIMVPAPFFAAKLQAMLKAAKQA